MKKLMMLAAAMTIVGSAFAEVAAYDYKATVKNVNEKKKLISVNQGYGVVVKINVMVKFIETSSLYGYLINDCDDCGEQGNGYGYLVVARKSGDGAKVPKIMPADLSVKIWNPKMAPTSTYEAQGYLFAGKGKQDWPFAAADTWASGIPYVYSFGASSDIYGQGTRFLFGTYNDSERTTVDGVTTLTFFDAWLDASGFGKAKTDSEDGGCGQGTSCTALDSLSGNVIGGLFLCYLNGSPFTYEGSLCNPWMGTSDVITGTWSIKRNTKLAPVALTDAERAPLNSGYGLAGDTIDSLLKAAAQAIKPGYSFTDTSAPTGKPNGLVNPVFATNYAMGLTI